jgi:ATP-dependent DNA helicase PIF1
MASPVDNVKRIVTKTGSLSIMNFMTKIPKTTIITTAAESNDSDRYNTSSSTEYSEITTSSGSEQEEHTPIHQAASAISEIRVIQQIVPVSTIEMSPEQELAFTKYKAGENVFITGPGGTGKSALIREIYNFAQQNGHNIQVCALTGCASVMLGCKAKTIHSWGGIGLANGDIDRIVDRVDKNFFKKKEWRKTRTLIIDEVSMMSKRLFEILDTVGRTVRNCASRPFGGIQLIFCGDFYQLPPVGSNTEDPDNAKFCFESDRWFQTFSKQNHIELKRIFRQNDPIYCEVLNQVREGRIKRRTDEILKSRVGAILPEFASDGTPQTKPTILCPTRSRADEINRTEMDRLGTKEESKELYSYKLKNVTDLPTTDKERHQRDTQTKERIQMELDMLKNSILCDEVVHLRVGSQVMCVINMEESMTTANTPICNGSQGIIVRMTEMTPRLPVVRFNNGLEMTINYHTWVSDNIPGIGVSQIPLILSWAITIHKSQGATLERCIIDIGDAVFEAGQSYVALSRIKSLEGVSIKSYDVRKIYVNKRVRDFYESLK